MKTLTLESAIKSSRGIKALLERELPRLFGGSYDIRTAVAWEGGPGDDDDTVNKCTDGMGAPTVHATIKCYDGGCICFPVMMRLCAKYERSVYSEAGELMLRPQTQFQKDNGECLLVRYFIG